MDLDPNLGLRYKMRARKRRAHFLKLGGEFDVWEMKMGDTVVVDNENVKIEKKGFFGESNEMSGCEIV